MAPRVIDETRTVRRRMRAGSFKSLNAAAAYVRGIARRSIGSGVKRNTKRGIREGGPERVYTPSKPGKPPKSPTGRLKNAIAFNVDKSRSSAVIGPVGSVFGQLGATHEFSGRERPKSPRRSVNWVLKIGGHGPIRDGALVPSGFARISTPAQLRRAQEIADAHEIPPWDRGTTPPRPRKYPARPFMGPALTRSRARLPAFWSNALKRS